MTKRLKFRSDEISGLLKNEGDHVGNLMRSLEVTTPVTLCQGYGVGHSVPLRLLAYAVPVLRLARQLPHQTRIEFYWATRGVIRACPNRDPAQLTKVSEVARSLLTSYVNAFHPDLRERVRIMDDVHPNDEAERAISELLTWAKGITEDVPGVASFVSKRGGVNALRYMAEHSLYMRDPMVFERGFLPLLVNGMEYPREGEHLLMVGGPSEKVFWRLRQELRFKVGIHLDWKSHQLFTSVGDPPTYHPQPLEPYGDVSKMSRSVSEPEIWRLLTWAEMSGSGPLKDWLVLLQDAAGVERFTITPGNEENPKAQQVLQEGLGRLMEWFRSIPLENRASSVR